MKKNLLIKLLLQFLFLFSVNILSAQDYYWVGAIDNDWSNGGNWADASGGTNTYTFAPGTGNNVIFDANSFSAPGTIIVTEGICQNMDWSGLDELVTLEIPLGESLEIRGDIILNFNLTITNLSTFPIILNANANFRTINTDGVAMPDLQLQESLGEGTISYELSGSLRAKSIDILDRVRLVGLGNSLIVDEDLSLSQVQSEIDMQDSEITIGGNFSTISEQSVGVNFSGSTIYMTGTAPGSTYNFNAGSFGLNLENVIFSGGKEYFLSGSSVSFFELRVTDGATLNINTSASVNITNLVLDGVDGNLVTLQSEDAPSIQSLIDVSNSVSANYANIEYIEIFSGTYPAFFSNDLGGNIGWVFLANDNPIQTIVTSSADSGLGTLREAFTLGSPYVDNVITFDIPGDNNTITLNSPLDLDGKEFTISGVGEVGLKIAGSGINQFFIDGTNSLVSKPVNEITQNLILADITFDIALVPENLDGQFINTEGDLSLINCTFQGATTDNSYMIVVNHTDTNISQNFLIDNCDFFNNSALLSGGLIYYESFNGDGETTFGSTFTVSNSYFINNQASFSDGGTIHMIGGGDLVVFGSTFEINSADNGGAIYVSGASASEQIDVTIFNSTFYSNSATIGGAIRVNNATVDITSSTITENNAGSNGGGIYFGQSTTSTILNSIISGNTDAVQPQDIFVDDFNGGVLTTNGYNFLGIVDLANAGTFTPDLTDLSGNDPLLELINDNGGTTLTMLPQLGSPVIDAGDPNALYTDQRGFARVGTPDIGAVEAGSRASQVIYVTETGAGDFTGQSWGHAFAGLQDALSYAIEGDEIWIAQGTYTPHLNDRTISFNIPADNIKIYGGFQGFEEGINERLPGYPTILSGDLTANDEPTVWNNGTVTFGNTNENSYHVVSVIDKQQIRIDGIVVRRGYANGVDENSTGGGIYISNADVNIKNVEFLSNYAIQMGGAILASFSELSIVDCFFERNSSDMLGGAVASAFSRVISYRSHYKNNFAANGGAISIANTNSTVNHLFLNRFEQNAANEIGGSLVVLQSDVVSFGNIYQNNFAKEENASSGGAISITGGSYAPTVYLINDTYYGNSTASGTGAAIHSSDGGSEMSLVLVNSVVWGNGTTPSSSVDIIDLAGFTMELTIANSIVESWNSGNYSGPVIDEGVVLTTDPLFEDAQNGNFTLMNSSPAISLGSTTLPSLFAQDLLDEDGDSNFTEIIPFDINQNPRLGDADRLDAGAIQFQGDAFPPLTIYVNAAATGTNEGTSWADAFTSLQNALLIASSSSAQTKVIYIAEGTYTPTPSADRTATFSIESGYELYGGFPSTGDPVFEDRDPDLYPTILSGDIGIALDNTDNSFHVMQILGGAGQSLIDGVTITLGNANSEGIDESIGAGILIEEGANTVISTTKVETNSADSDGGGIFIKTNTDVFIQNGYFYNNTSGNDGGAIFDDRATSGSFKLFKSIFTENIASNNGGALHSNGTFSTGAGNPISHSEFYDNSAGNSGGGVYLEGSEAEIVNSLIYNNNAVNAGGGVYVAGEFTATSSNVVDNFLTTDIQAGAGIFRFGISNFTISNSIVYGNEFDGDNTFEFQIGDNSGSGSNMVISYSIVQDADFATSTYSNIFLLSSFDQNPNFEPDSFIPSFTSPALDAGLEAFLPTDVYDLDGDEDTGESIPQDFNLSARVFGASVDIGAFEQQTSLDEVQRTALAAIYDALGGDNWSNNTNWKSAASLDQWYGVQIHEISGAVIGLGLGENNLSGTIPAEIGDLFLLENLDFFNNNISGSIPTAIGNLTNLSNLDLRNNQLTGEIPIGIYDLNNLVRFGVGSNQLTGTISPFIGSLNNLTFIDIGANNLTGPIPEEIGDILGLMELYITEAPGYTGEIPLNFINLTSLNIFGFQNTNLCEPSDPTYQSWKSTVSEYSGSGLVCGATVSYPSNANAKMVTGTQAVLRWDDTNNTFPTEYVIHRSDGDNLNYVERGRFTIEESISPNLYIFIDGGLSKGTEYFYKVKAVQGAEESIFSNESSIITTIFDFELESQSYLSILPHSLQSMSWADIDGDGLEDMFLGKFASSISPNNILLKKDALPSNTFTQIPLSGTAQLTQNVSSRSSTWGDFDNDGLIDFIMGVDNFQGNVINTSLHLNNGDETFREISLGLPETLLAVTSGDFNHDGLLDFAGVGQDETFNVYVGLSEVQSFVDGVENHYTIKTVAIEDSAVWAINAADYDNDGNLDLVMPSRGGANNITILKGSSTGQFTAIPPLGSLFSTGVTWVDINNDTNIDLVVGSQSDIFLSKVFINNGSGQLIETTTDLKAPMRGMAFGDYDNDGDLDLFSAIGTGKYYENIAGTFSENTSVDFTLTGLEFLASATTVDYNNDGKLDFASVGDAPMIYKNTSTNGNNFATIKLKSAKDNFSVIGANVSIALGGPKTLRMVSGQSSSASQSSNILHFGLGVSSPSSATVTWPDGVITSHPININGFTEITRGELLDFDSLALVDAYRFTKGVTWTSKIDWFSSIVDLWEGVTVSGGRVTELDLSSNNLQDSLIGSFSDLDGLSILNLSGNELKAIPNLDFLNFSASVNVANNRLLFDDIAPNVGLVDVFTYSPQKTFGTASSQTVNFGDAISLSFPVSLGNDAVYQWTKDGQPIAGATSATLNFTIDGIARAGQYRLTATRPDVPDLTLTSEPITITVSTISQDIDALRAIYTALGGANWTNRTNWTQNEDVASWFGVTLDVNLRVTGLNLPSNNLVGTIPTAILNLPFLQTLNVSGNRITGLPTLTSITTLTSVNISNNNLFFPQITPNVGVAGLVYQPQKPFGTPDTIRVLLSQEATFDVLANLTTAGNAYRWRLAGTALTDEGSDAQTFTLRNIELTDAGLYTLAVTNPAAPLLTLVSNAIWLNVINEYPVNLRDSVALLSIYQSLNGASWARRANWTTDSLKKWQGVTLLRGNVSGLDLSSNNLSGTFPTLAADQLNSLENLNLSGNQGVILPTTFSSMNGLTTLNLSNMDVSAIPNATGLNALTNLNVSNNKLQFGDLQPFIGTSTFNYTPQENLGTVQSLNFNEGDNINIVYTLEGTGMTYQWFKDGAFNGVTTANYQREFNVNDNGSYYLEVKHPQLPALTLSSNLVTYRMRNSTSDSLALVRMYQNLGGAEWTRKNNWLSATAPVSEWQGVTYADGKVRALDLSTNNLQGVMSAFTGYELSELTAFNLAGNDLTVIPSLTNLNRLATLNVENNQLQFGSLESQPALGANFTYNPQKTIYAPVDSIREVNLIRTISRTISGTGNNYQWYKTVEGVRSEYTATSNVITFNPVVFEDEGDYELEITNPSVPGLVLTTAPITLFVASLQRDTRVLQALFDQLGGTSWTNVAANWRAEPLSQPEITLNSSGTRVAEINLSNKGLVGNVPSVLRTMTDVVSLNLSNNRLTFIPALKQGMSGLSALNVSNNLLQYQSIQNNLDVQNYTFAPQANLSEKSLVRQPQGTEVRLQAVSTGTNLTYQWFFKANASAPETALSVNGATESIFTIPVLEYENMGLYFCRVRNAETTLRSADFNLRTGEFLVQATANIEGEVTDLNGEVRDFRRAVLYRIAPVGTPYPPVDTSLVVSGKYIFDNIVLNDFIIRVAPTPEEEEEYIATYANSGVTWDAADRVALRRNMTKNTVLQFTPTELPVDPDAGVVRGNLDLEEDDFPELFSNTTGRLEARRRVANAGVSFSRLRATNRTGDDRIFEFIAYVFTDENGEFLVENLPDGTYKVNFDFPGVPTDPTSFVEFDLGGGGTVGSNKLTLNGDIQRTGIVVSKVEETGIKRSFISDMKAYPVPFDQILNLEFNMLKAAGVDYDIQLMTIDGKLISSTNQYISEGRNKLQLNVPTVGAGVYLIVIADENGAPIFTGKILK